MNVYQGLLTAVSPYNKASYATAN